MKEDKNSFDDLIRKKLEGDEESMEPSLWVDIEKQLPAVETKKRFAYWRLVALLLLITIPVSLIYYFNGHEKTESEAVKVDGNTKQASSEINVEQSDVTAAETNEQATIIQQTNVNEGSSALSSVTKVAKTQNKVEKVNSVVAEISTSDMSEDGNNNEQTFSANSGSAQSASGTAAVNDNTSVVNEQNKFPLQSEIVPTVAEEINPVTEEPKPEATKTDSLVTQKIKTTNWFVEIFYAPEYAKKTFELNNDDVNYLNLRKNTEQFIYAHSFGIRAGRRIGKNMTFKTGMDFSELQYQLTYGYLPGQVPLPAGLKIDSITGFFIDPLNNGILISQDTTVANYELVGQTSEINRYRLYNVPVIFSYVIRNKKMKLETSVGGFVNIISKQKGSIIGDDRISRINLEEDKKRTPYKKSVGGGICAEVLMTYSIRPQLKFIIGPHIKYYLGMLNKSNAPLNENLFTTGLLTGFRVEF